MSKSKKETQAQQVERLIKEAVGGMEPSMTSFTNCEITGLKFDESVLESITTIADGLCENARALGTLAAVLSTSGLKIGTLISIQDGKIRLGGGAADE